MTPGIDLVRMVSSGTEACMRVQSGWQGVYTGKNKIIKFEGHYHGHADSFLVKAGSGLATFNIQSVPGVTAGVANDTLVAPYNDLEAVKKLILEHKGEVAAIIVEPVAGNMGCILPAAGFFRGLEKNL
jgi:glutamate-1-semialdehyde 2,1-aminomutase